MNVLNNNSISVVVPAYNEARGIASSLENLIIELSKLDCDYEIIIVDEDLDRNPDIAVMDRDEDGKGDVIAYDYNQDGEWDKFEDMG